MLLLIQAYATEDMFRELAALRHGGLNTQLIIDGLMQEGANSYAEGSALGEFAAQLEAYARHSIEQLAEVRRAVLANEPVSARSGAPDTAGADSGVFSFPRDNDYYIYEELFESGELPDIIIEEETVVHFSNETTVSYPARPDFPSWELERHAFRGDFRLFLAPGSDPVTLSFLYVFVSSISPLSNIEVIICAKSLEIVFSGMAADFSTELLEACLREYIVYNGLNPFPEAVNMDIIEQYLEELRDSDEVDFANFALAAAFVCMGGHNDDRKDVKLVLIDTRHRRTDRASSPSVAAATVHLEAEEAVERERKESVSCPFRRLECVVFRLFADASGVLDGVGGDFNTSEALKGNSGTSGTSDAENVVVSHVDVTESVPDSPYPQENPGVLDGPKNTVNHIVHIPHIKDTADALIYFRERLCVLLANFTRTEPLIVWSGATKTTYIVWPIIGENGYVGIAAQSLEIDELLQALSGEFPELVASDVFLLDSEEVFYTGGHEAPPVLHDPVGSESPKIDENAAALLSGLIPPLLVDRVRISGEPLQKLYAHATEFRDGLIVLDGRTPEQSAVNTELNCLQRRFHEKESRKMLNYKFLDLQGEMQGMMVMLVMPDDEFQNQNFSEPEIYFDPSPEILNQYLDCETFKESTGLEKCLDDYVNMTTLKLPIHLLQITSDGRRIAPEPILQLVQEDLRVSISNILKAEGSIKTEIHLLSHNIEITFPRRLVLELKQLVIFLVLGYNNIDFEALDKVSAEFEAYKHCILMTSLRIQLCIRPGGGLYYISFETSLELKFSTTYNVVGSGWQKNVSCPMNEVYNSLELQEDNLVMHLTSILSNKYVANSFVYKDEALAIIVPFSKLHKMFTYQLVVSYNLAKYDYYRMDNGESYHNKVLLNEYAFLVFHPKLLSIRGEHTATTDFHYDIGTCEHMYFSLELIKLLFKVGALEMGKDYYSGQSCAVFEFTENFTNTSFVFKENSCAIERIMAASLYEMICQNPIIDIEESRYPCFSTDYELNEFFVEFGSEWDTCVYSDTFYPPLETQTTVSANADHKSNADIWKKSLLIFFTLALFLLYLVLSFPQKLR